MNTWETGGREAPTATRCPGCPSECHGGVGGQVRSTLTARAAVEGKKVLPAPASLTGAIATSSLLTRVKMATEEDRVDGVVQGRGARSITDNAVRCAWRHDGKDAAGARSLRLFGLPTNASTHATADTTAEATVDARPLRLASPLLHPSSLRFCCADARA